MNLGCVMCDRSVHELSERGWCVMCEAEFVRVMAHVKCALEGCASPVTCLMQKRCVQMRAAIVLTVHGE
jgi:hypothetical protein